MFSRSNLYIRVVCLTYFLSRDYNKYKQLKYFIGSSFISLFKRSFRNGRTNSLNCIHTSAQCTRFILHSTQFIAFNPFTKLMFILELNEGQRAEEILVFKRKIAKSLLSFAGVKENPFASILEKCK